MYRGDSATVVVGGGECRDDQNYKNSVECNKRVSSVELSIHLPPSPSSQMNGWIWRVKIHTGGVWRVLRSSGSGPGTTGRLGSGTDGTGRAAAGALWRTGRQVIGDAHQRRHRVAGPVLLVLRARLPAAASTDRLHGRRSVRRRPGRPAGGQR